MFEIKLMHKKKTILIVDDHPLFRDGLVLHLSKQAGYEVVGETTSGEDGIAKARELNPALVIMDISLPDMNGIDATRQIRGILPDTRVIVLSMHTKIAFITDAFRAGASAYLTKDATAEKLVECLQAVTNGEFYMDPAISQTVVKNILMTEEEMGSVQDPAYSTLTSREQEVMRLIAEGLPTKQVAERLFISQKTVENHRANIFSKLDIHSTMELVRYAAKFGIIDVDLWKE